MTTIHASKARIPPKAFNEVAYKGKRLRVERRGGDTVYLISAQDMAKLEKLEDLYWTAEGKKALAEFERSGRKAIPWGQTRRKAGL